MLVSRRVIEFKMKVFITFVLLALTQAGAEIQAATEEGDGASMKYFLVERGDGSFVVEDLTNSEIQVRAQESDMSYRFFTRKDPLKGTDIFGNNVAVLANTDFSASNDLIFLVHGWDSDKDGDFNKKSTEAILSSYNVNVIVVDWYPIAKQNYITAKNGVDPVGKYVGAFIDSLVSTYGVQLSKVTCAGHSLGAHICGNAGAYLKGRIGRIVALDAAGPLFSTNDVNGRLDPTDAQFVEAIHTNGGLLGMSASIGHVDYFPNGGQKQPGCGLDLLGGCSHERSFLYWVEAIKAISTLFRAVLCSSNTDFNNGRCSSNAVSIMGSFYPDTKLRGNFYLTTNSNPPYARG